MLNINEVIIVEGRYDRCRLSGVVNSQIVETSGFSIFNDAQLRNYILSLAHSRGIIIMTDSDAAGFQIRNYIKSFVPNELIKNAYIPDIYGKEKRKRRPSKENKLGVEGIPNDILEKILVECGASVNTGRDINKEFITKSDFFSLGLSGRPNSSDKRKILTDYLGLPERISSNDMITYINAVMDEKEFYDICLKCGILQSA